MSRLNDLEEDYENCESIARDNDNLQSQLDEVYTLRERSDEIHADIAKLHSDYKVLVANGDVMDDYHLQREVEMLLKKDQRLHCRIEQRAEDVSRIQNQVHMFEAKIEDALARIQRVCDAEERLGDVPVTVDDILAQQKEFEVCILE